MEEYPSDLPESGKEEILFGRLHDTLYDLRARHIIRTMGEEDYQSYHVQADCAERYYESLTEAEAEAIEFLGHYDLASRYVENFPEHASLARFLRPDLEERYDAANIAADAMLSSLMAPELRFDTVSITEEGIVLERADEGGKLFRLFFVQSGSSVIKNAYHLHPTGNGYTVEMIYTNDPRHKEGNDLHDAVDRAFRELVFSMQSAAHKLNRLYHQQDN